MSKTTRSTKGNGRRFAFIPGDRPPIEYDGFNETLHDAALVVMVGTDDEGVLTFAIDDTAGACLELKRYLTDTERMPRVRWFKIMMLVPMAMPSECGCDCVV